MRPRTERVIELERWAGRVGEFRKVGKGMAMDPAKMLQDLLEQRRLIDATIGNVERLVAASKRRGRPLKAVMEARSIVGKQASPRKRKRGRPPANPGDAS